MTPEKCAELLAHWQELHSRHRSYQARAADSKVHIAHLRALVAGGSCPRCGRTLEHPLVAICCEDAS